MSKAVTKNLLTIGFLVTCFGLIWLLNQKKNFNPVLSIQTNLSFKSKKNLNYSDLGSTIEILKLIQIKDSSFKMLPTLKEIVGDLPNENKQFSELGRVISNNKDTVVIYEYANSSKAMSEFERLKPFYGNKNLKYKNLIINFASESQILFYLRDNLQ